MIVGLTGGIGAGKSAVAQGLERRGAIVIDTDAIAREVVEPPSPVLDKIRTIFGDAVLRADGHLDRGALAGVVFADDRRREQLNQITHPEILKRVLARIGAYPPSAIVVVVAPLLYESGFDRNCEAVVAVTAPEELRIERVMRRDGAREQDVRARVRAQLGEAERAARATFVVRNDRDESALDRAIDDLWRDLRDASERTRRT